MPVYQAPTILRQARRAHTQQIFGAVISFSRSCGHSAPAKQRCGLYPVLSGKILRKCFARVSIWPVNLTSSGKKHSLSVPALRILCGALRAFFAGASSALIAILFHSGVVPIQEYLLHLVSLHNLPFNMQSLQPHRLVLAAVWREMPAEHAPRRQSADDFSGALKTHQPSDLSQYDPWQSAIIPSAARFVCSSTDRAGLDRKTGLNSNPSCQRVSVIELELLLLRCAVCTQNLCPRADLQNAHMACKTWLATEPVATGKLSCTG